MFLNESWNLSLKSVKLGSHTKTGTSEIFVMTKPKEERPWEKIKPLMNLRSMPLKTTMMDLQYSLKARTGPMQFITKSALEYKTITFYLML